MKSTDQTDRTDQTDLEEGLIKRARWLDGPRGLRTGAGIIFRLPKAQRWPPIVLWTRRGAKAWAPRVQNSALRPTSVPWTVSENAYCIPVKYLLRPNNTKIRNIN